MEKKHKLILACVLGALVLTVAITGFTFWTVGAIKAGAGRGIGGKFDQQEYAVDGASVVTYRSTSTVADVLGKGELGLSCGRINGVKTL